MEIFQQLIDRYVAADPARAARRGPGRLALSLSSVRVGLEHEQADELTREIHRAMAAFATDGMVTEVVETEALIARR